MQIQPTTASPAPVFQVYWEDPEEARLTWRHDRMHAPRPVTPLTGDLAARAFERGFNAAAATFALPLRARFRSINTYAYQAVVPPPNSPEELEHLQHQTQERLMGTLARLLPLWQQEWLPEIQERLASWDRFDLAGASTEELAAHLEDTERWYTRLWEIHFQLGIPFLLAPSLFEEMYSQLFRDREPLEAYRLIEGFDNKTVETERALWRLSRAALAKPHVVAAFATIPGAAVMEALETTTEGRQFLVMLCDYLAEYGERSNEFTEFANPSWIEDPTPVLDSLRHYLQQPERDLDQEAASATAERESLVAAARQRLRDYPQPVVEQFEFLLRAAQQASFLHCEHAFWIDQKGMYRVRRAILEAGRRLAREGVLEQEGDVFFLRLDEIEDVLRSPVSGLRERIAGRRAEMERFAGVEPLPVVGAMPSGPPPDSPLHRAITKFIGGPPILTAEEGALNGYAGSPGVARGPARVLGSLAEAGKLRPGDILVAKTTAPPWTPLFSTAGGVVTDTGGVLSHCAVVAREYRIPAVVGTGTATSRIHDGQLLEVDGSRGIVRMIS
ncbi:MAG TPA: PEP-utilizing enzyme [Thermoanaerobaculia bacterium]